jgi:hypothetical protein
MITHFSDRENAMMRCWRAAAFFVLIGPANAADLSLQLIILSSGGVGQHVVSNQMGDLGVGLRLCSRQRRMPA